MQPGDDHLFNSETKINEVKVPFPPVHNTDFPSLWLLGKKKRKYNCIRAAWLGTVIVILKVLRLKSQYKEKNSVMQPQLCWSNQNPLILFWFV